MSGLPSLIIRSIPFGLVAFSRALQIDNLSRRLKMRQKTETNLFPQLKGGERHVFNCLERRANQVPAHKETIWLICRKVIACSHREGGTK